MRALPLHSTAIATWFTAVGIQLVLFPWLVAVVLTGDAFAVGLAQAATLAPALLLLPLGGLVADRDSPRRLLLACHLLGSIPPMLLAGVLLSSGHSGYALLLAYGLAVGAIGAFAAPARDALLPALVGTGALSRIVPQVMALQFLAQLVGIGFAWSADRLGAVPLLVVSAVLLLVGAMAVTRLPKDPVRLLEARADVGRGMLDGVAVAMRSGIWPVLLLTLGVGLFFIGPFMAILPLVVRDVFHGGAAELSLVNFAFWAATIAVSMTLARFARRVVRRGRLIVLAVTSGIGVLVALATLPPFPLFVALIFLWGIGAGTIMTQSRTVVQVASAPSHRARLMALFQLGLNGGGPIGAIVAGAIGASPWGVPAALILPAMGMASLTAFVIIRSSLWTLRADHDESGN